MNGKRHIKTVEKLVNTWLVNGRVIIDENGVLWNAWYSDKPRYKDFPQYYFDLRDELFGVKNG